MSLPVQLSVLIDLGGRKQECYIKGYSKTKYLLPVKLAVRKIGRYMKHDFVVAPGCVDGVFPCRIVSHIQSPFIFRPSLQCDLLPENLQELFKLRRSDICIL